MEKTFKGRAVRYWMERKKTELTIRQNQNKKINEINEIIDE